MHADGTVGESARTGEHALPGAARLFVLRLPLPQQPLADVLGVLVDGGGAAFGGGAGLFGRAAGWVVGVFQDGRGLVAVPAEIDHLGDPVAGRGRAVQFMVLVGLLAPRVTQLAEYLLEGPGGGVAGCVLRGAVGGVCGPRSARSRANASSHWSRAPAMSAAMRCTVLVSRPRVIAT
jgi:hypothetical protein